MVMMVFAVSFTNYPQEMAQWVQENTAGRITHVYDQLVFLTFDDDAEAVMYRFAWGCRCTDDKLFGCAFLGKA